MTISLLEVENLTCHYGPTKILENISLQIGAGDFTGVLGPNASGKTSLIRSTGGLLRPTSGTIRLDGKNLYSMRRKEIAKTIAVVPQTSHFDSGFSVFDAVLMGRTPHLGWLQNEDQEDLEIAAKMMRLLEINELADRRLGELSGGEMQKVLIARALTQQPRMLLLDEPTTHLDISSKIAAMKLIKELCLEEDLAVMAVFHDLNLAARYCDSAILLRSGRPVASGPVDQVIRNETIRKTFGVNVEVKRHPRTGCIFTVPLIDLPRARENNKGRIHIVCGGETGSALLTELTRLGYSVTAGVLNVLDTDNETAHELGIPVVDEAPFSPISQENHKEHLKMISSSQLVILSPVPFGKGNMKNLEATLWAQRKGKNVLMIERGKEDGDFTGGTAGRFLHELRSGGARTVRDKDEAISEAESILTGKDRRRRQTQRPAPPTDPESKQR